MFGIDYLISPYKLDVFTKCYLGKNVLLIRGNSKKFFGLFEWPDINHIYNFTRWAFPGCKLVHDGSVLPAESHKRLTYWLNRGATLILDHVQNKDPAINHFARALEKEVNTTVNVNCYISILNKQSIDCHFDRHDVFVTQLYGKKKWLVYAPELSYPIPQMANHSKNVKPSTEPLLECVLSAGDVLYIPRGFPHQATAISSSVHLAVGIMPRTPIDFLEFLVKKELQNEKLAPGADIMETLKQLKNNLQSNGLYNDFLKFIMEMNPAFNKKHSLCLPFQIDLEHRITPDTAFSIADLQKGLVKHDQTGRTTELYIRGQTVDIGEIPLSFIETLITCRNCISGNDLLRDYPDIGWKKVKEILLLLEETGFLNEEIKNNT